MMRHDRRRLAIVALLATTSSTACGKNAGSIGKSIAVGALTAAVAVAAAAARSKGCSTTCPDGTVCVPEDDTCAASLGCDAGDPYCGMTPDYLRATEDRAPEADSPLDDSCAGFCRSTERCVVYRGDLDCVPR